MLPTALSSAHLLPVVAIIGIVVLLRFIKVLTEIPDQQTKKKKRRAAHWDNKGRFHSGVKWPP
jgi:hypothetical protein